MRETVMGPVAVRLIWITTPGNRRKRQSKRRQYVRTNLHATKRVLAMHAE